MIFYDPLGILLNSAYIKYMEGLDRTKQGSQNVKSTQSRGRKTTSTCSEASFFSIAVVFAVVFLKKCLFLHWILVQESQVVSLNPHLLWQK